VSDTRCVIAGIETVGGEGGPRGFTPSHRSSWPDAVRHMSLASAAHRRTVTHLDTWRDKKETACRAAFPQLAGRFRWWWQVRGSNLVGEADGFTARRLCSSRTPLTSADAARGGVRGRRPLYVRAPEASVAVRGTDRARTAMDGAVGAVR
jgi:hypothetical protein